jgi:rsbT antagonist protein RsbS
VTGTATPWSRVGDDLLVILQGNLDDRAVLQVEQVVTSLVATGGVRGVVIDASKLKVVDSFMARVLTRVVVMIRLMGAETVVAGIQPAVAITLVEMGLSLGSVRTALTPARGLAALQRSSG